MHFEPTLRVEFGFNISAGDDFYVNFDCVMLDGGGITMAMGRSSDRAAWSPRTSRLAAWPRASLRECSGRSPTGTAPAGRADVGDPSAQSSWLRKLTRASVNS